MTIIDPRRLTITVHSKQTCGSAGKANSKGKEHGTEVPCSLCFYCPTGGR